MNKNCEEQKRAILYQTASCKRILGELAEEEELSSENSVC